VTPDEFFEKWLKAWDETVVRGIFPDADYISCDSTGMTIDASKVTFEQLRMLSAATGATDIEVGGGGYGSEFSVTVYVVPPRPTTAHASDEPPIGRT
jgi:hypothetical protein